MIDVIVAGSINHCIQVGCVSFSIEMGVRIDEV